ncbi:MAG: heme NO-binding domain-containing protein [Planctomycetaceae bacterium]|nr:heme NO-binding domain-containing protein [Planctomycetaceae bacterium]
MKGIAFTLLNELVEQSFGMETWDTVLQRTGLDGIFTAAGSYPDDDVFRIVTVLSEISGLPPEVLVRTFGEFMFKGFVEQYPHFFPEGQKARELLKSVDSIIHVEVRKLFPDAAPPTFACEERDDGTLLMTYRSPRRLCILAEGLINGAAQYFQEPITHRQIACMYRGADHCCFELTFGGSPDAC